jgi:RNA polymerase sigma-70 factor (ECF subfamily)
VPLDPETRIGGGDRDFPSTHWSTVASDLDALARDYWKPVYAYVRARHPRTNEDAKDLTQDFFAWMIESGFARRADPARGRFRAFLKVAVDHYLRNDLRDRRALKRGGGRPALPIAEVADPDQRTPEEIMDQVWRDEILRHATARLEAECAAAGRETRFALFRDYFVHETGTYAEAAARHGISIIDVSNHLMEAKRRFRAILTDIVARTVDSPGALEEELALLFGR